MYTSLSLISFILHSQALKRLFFISVYKNLNSSTTPLMGGFYMFWPIYYKSHLLYTLSHHPLKIGLKKFFLIAFVVSPQCSNELAETLS